MLLLKLGLKVQHVNRVHNTYIIKMNANCCLLKLTLVSVLLLQAIKSNWSYKVNELHIMLKSSSSCNLDCIGSFISTYDLLPCSGGALGLAQLTGAPDERPYRPEFWIITLSCDLTLAKYL